MSQDATQQLLGMADKRVLITGAAGVIGQVLCARFAQLGSQVVGVDRNQEPLEQMQHHGVLDSFVVADLGAAGAGQQCLEATGPVQVLINNAGTGREGHLRTTTEEMVEVTLEANYKAAYRMCRAYLPSMRQQGGGKIVNVSSVLGPHPVPAVSAYAAAKAAVIAFTRSIALEVATEGIQCNVLAPGYLQGPKNEDYFASKSGRAFIRRFMPGGAPGVAEDLVGPAVFLASAMSGHVTGQVLVVDGGYSIW